MFKPKVSICVLTYGHYTALVQKCINSIVAMCPKGQYKLIVGANAINEETRSQLVTMKKRKWIHELIISEKNLNKCPMMRKMFQRTSKAGEKDALQWWIYES